MFFHKRKFINATLHSELMITLRFSETFKDGNVCFLFLNKHELSRRNSNETVSKIWILFTLKPQ